MNIQNITSGHRLEIDVIEPIDFTQVAKFFVKLFSKNGKILAVSRNFNEIEEAYNHAVGAAPLLKHASNYRETFDINEHGAKSFRWNIKDANFYTAWRSSEAYDRAGSRSTAVRRAMKYAEAPVSMSTSAKLHLKPEDEQSEQ